MRVKYKRKAELEPKRIRFSSVVAALSLCLVVLAANFQSFGNNQSVRKKVVFQCCGGGRK